jgi:UDP:flavonoid glycosyltransferase YjiC (YdhE family)
VSRFVLACSGTLGDVHPFVAIGAGLHTRGHDVAVATAAPYRAMVEQAGLEFRPVRPDIAPVSFGPEVARRVHDHRTGTEYLIRTLVLPHLEAMYADLMDACEGADLMAVHPIMFAAPTVAEVRRLRWLSLKQSPGSFVSAHDPPILPPFPWLHALRHLGATPNRVVFDLFSRVTRQWMTPVDALRKTLGLPPPAKHPILAGMLSDLGTLAAFPHVLGRPQPDWPPHTRITGYAFHDPPGAGAPVDPALDAFLDAGEPPVVFTLGSSAVRDGEAFMDESLRAIRDSGRRALLLTGAADARPRLDGRGVFVTGYVPHGRLFSRAAAVVHHGGMGTLAHALYAGAPMLIVPFVNDQHDNGFRAARLGVARVVPRARYRGAHVARELDMLLRRPGYRSRARTIAAELASEDGVANACAVLTAAVARSTADARE